VTRLPWGSDALASNTDGANLFIAGNNLFKHAPALGELLAAAAADGTFPADLSPSRRLGDAALVSDPPPPGSEAGPPASR
jgi:sarcosine oxidase